MSFFKRPVNWLYVAASAAGFWITLGVVTAVPRPQPSPADSLGPADARSARAAQVLVEPAREETVPRLAVQASAEPR